MEARRLTLAALLPELLPGISPEAGRKGIRSSVGLHLRAGSRVQGAILELGAPGVLALPAIYNAMFTMYM